MKKVINVGGKRKTAIARATVKKGRGRVRINRTPIEIYTPELCKLRIQEPLWLAGKKVEKVDIEVKVKGGGVTGQADAVRTSIAKGLVRYYGDKMLEDKYMQYDKSLLVGDPRRKETKHPMGRGARKKRQKSYR